MRKVIWNGGALLMSWIFGHSLKANSHFIFDHNSVYPEASLLLIQLFFTANILLALYPLFRPTDNLSDIPLTPTQRALLGLDPTATPPLTPGTTYVTPPRYRVSTSRKGSPASQNGSPLSATPTFSERRVSSGTPFSPASSPLFHKAVATGGRDTGRRPSFGSSSPLGRSNSFSNSLGNSLGTSMGNSFGNSFGESSLGPSTPSPLAGKRTSLSVSNKWLYERTRRLSASNGSM
ncbi:uncharacterized protein N7503_011601 [Penicillium pulvis]|uniref:uncharacterized protein n=1 Tax=Penicillium pulvis TaxID=1562058 RepID=UPI002548327D|nr:uncharacterized protein N7503_011601 [Penicillium pulvis]KAJ5786389.1 hypothetical protein N7503_011601 [Penicillium pulvis]